MKCKISLLMFAAVLATGCSIYHPQAVDIPLIDHKGDVRVDVSAAMSAMVVPDVVTMNTTVSYGFTDWLAGQAHINYGGDNYYAQVAPGAYYPLGEHGLLEGYVGVGYGGAWSDNTDKQDDNPKYDYKGSFAVPFGQVNIGWRNLTAAHIDLAMGLKAGSYLPSFNYREYNADGSLKPEGAYSYNTANVLLEPQFIFRIGSQHVKFCLRGSFAWLSDMYSDNPNAGADKFVSDIVTLSAGINFTF